MSLTTNQSLIDELFSVGAHYAFSKSRRHPSAKPFIFGAKNGTEIFDLEMTAQQLEDAIKYVEKLASEGKTMLFLSSKPEARQAIVDAATKAGQPYVVDRWVGGTLTNFTQMRKRVQKLEDLKKKREKGDLSMFTKKERLLIDREIEALEDRFGGIAELENIPHAMFIVDTRDEEIAMREAERRNIPIIALIGSDNDASKIEKPIFANDSARRSIDFIVDQIAEAFKKGAAKAPRKAAATTDGTQAPRSSVVISRAGDKSDDTRQGARFVRAGDQRQQGRSGQGGGEKRAPRTLRA